MKNIFVEYIPWSRTGNLMFQLAFAKILADQTKRYLHHPELPCFNLPNRLSQTLPEKSIIRTRKYGNHKVNIQELQQTDLDIVIDSFLQKAEYYITYKELLQTFFNIQIPTTPINQNKLVIHIRETDYKLTNACLSYNNYKKIIHETNFTEIILVTDDSNSETVRKLVNDGCTLNTTGAVEYFNPVLDDRGLNDFKTLLYSENIAISHSSFSWWAAFLGEHKKIFFPFKEKGGLWELHPKDDRPDLFFDLGNSYKIIL